MPRLNARLTVYAKAEDFIYNLSDLKLEFFFKKL